MNQVASRMVGGDLLIGFLMRLEREIGSIKSGGEVDED